ncbi:MAG: hypothetical protein KDA27_28680 [Candidatus Eisenbacteria bacterium]|uniref:Uncharacterized protein n=1 Tax=Eiseniibacteriota bacterium TaxID=2212470 RepID=A0A956NJH5_UNCEI|nr:hypothetical protein [Candidatus Eisenbacteria bacterium]
MRKPTLLALAFLTLIAPQVRAGANHNGTLVWHLDSTVAYTTDLDYYCGASGIACGTDLSGCDNGYDHQDDCRERIGSLNPTGPPDTGTYVASVLAAFPEGSCPELKAASFGLGDYDTGNVTFVDYGPCASVELNTAGWPGPNEGTAVTFSNVVRSQLIEIYWFAAYAYYTDRDGSLPLTGGPDGEGFFSDDSDPVVHDPIVGFSTLGLKGDRLQRTSDWLRCNGGVLSE